MTGETQLEEICLRVAAFISGDSSFAFERLALEVFRFQFEFNRPYRRFCETRLGGTAVGNVEQIPAIPAAAFKELELSALVDSERSTIFHSSGTTEHKPSRHFHSVRTLAVYEESLLAWFKPWIMPEIDRANFLVLAPPAAEAPHSSLVHMFDKVAKQFAADLPAFCATAGPDGSWTQDFNRIMEAHANFTKRGKPVIICGTAFSFVHLLDELNRTGQRLTFPAGSRVFETGGYKGRSRAIPKDELHEQLSESLGIPASHIVSEYGMSELSSQAYDRRTSEDNPRIFHFPPWARTNVISPETGRPAGDGETGLLQILDLANVGSVMALQTEDLAIRRGTGFELIGRAALAEPRGCSLLQINS